ncbi:trace amine-associated receptor 1-like [Epinephelus fuscoguttatus]|uniref:trace amine-associated receptor 1-like n=1 Tax=Epinephelus fuscoguttatus TaxID=293821 RepID=UPI0020D0FD73|nr:trace amine-associated receptor 1-like [Epinephelus fuscoguttatus]
MILALLDDIKDDIEPATQRSHALPGIVKLVSTSDARMGSDGTRIPVITSYVLCVFVACLSVLIMSGNLLVIISIIYFKQLHTPTNYLILSLAVADLLVGVVVMPFSTILAVSSCWHLEGLLYRYYAVCQPLRYRTKITVHVIVIMILVSWTVSALNGIGLTIRGLNEEQSNKCVLFQRLTSLGIMGTFFAYYLPGTVMFIIYLKILMVSQRQQHPEHNLKMERKATKTLAIVMGVFLICWTPFFLSFTVYPLSNYTIPVSVIASFKWLGWSNSMLNPFVYGFFYTWFQTSFKMIISGKIFQGAERSGEDHGGKAGRADTVYPSTGAQVWVTGGARKRSADIK